MDAEWPSTVLNGFSGEVRYCPTGGLVLAEALKRIQNGRFRVHGCHALMDISLLTGLVFVHTLIGLVHALVFTETPSGIRVISFRKANDREVKKYENAK